ncbi:MAG: hypothetical protein HYZ01_08555 [Ignavibacteriales bacterium]|nr:hypothetical protein [Ignavibacteriales bacterium]
MTGPSPGNKPLQARTPVAKLSSQPVDPLERFVPLGLKIALFLFCILMLYQALDVFIYLSPRPQLPAPLSFIRMFIFLPMHEGGHMLFFWLGRTMSILGGSFWQIMFPLLSFAIALRQHSTVVGPFALFWTGINMMDVSLYMRDAPHRILPLLGGHKSGHDWWNLFRTWDMMESAETIADLMYFGGVFVSGISIMAGIGFAVYYYSNPPPMKQKFYQDPKELTHEPISQSDLSTKATKGHEW